MTDWLELPAIKIKQAGQEIFAFGVDGKDIPTFAAVSRAHRDGEVLEGYQRPEVISHIRAIRRYLESEDALLPNAVVIAFDDRVQFRTATKTDGAFSSAGLLRIPLDSEDKPGWLVDGQQRTAAIREARVDSFPVAAVGFIATTDEQQRSQFILVNNTKPLPKGLIHEMLPDTVGHLPPAYARRRLPATLMIRMHTDPKGPFYSRVSMPTSSEGNIKDTSVLRMIEASLYDGALYQYRDPATGEGDEDSMLLHLNFFWSAVRDTWPEAWELSPKESRLTHGAGLRAIGHLMDSWTEDVPAAELPGLGIPAKLEALKPRTAWTGGSWDLRDGESRRWNSWQNTPGDIARLTAELRLDRGIA